MKMKRNQVSDCDGCCSEDPWILHNVYHRGIIRRFCTSCVLKFNSGSFCAVCFQVFDASSLPKDRVLCLKCPSFAHIDCIKHDFKDSAGLYNCPPCSNRNFSFFQLDSNKKTRPSGSEGESMVVENPTRRCIDLKMAKVLVAASQIALASITKAATAKRLEAESRVKEAAFARKRLKDSLEQFLKNSQLNPCKDHKDNENHNGTVPIPIPPAIVQEKKKRKKKKKKAGIESKENHKETIETSNPIPSAIFQKKKKRKKKENRKETIGTSKSVISAIINPIRKNKKKKKKSKSISDVTAKEGLLNKLKADAERNDKSQKIKESFNNGEREGVSQVSPSKVMKRNPFIGISIQDGDKLKRQNCGIMKGNKSSSQTFSHSHTIKGDKENKDLHPVHHVTKDCQHRSPNKFNVN